MRYLTGILVALALSVGSVMPVAAGGPAPVGLVHLTLQLKWLPQAQFGGYFVAQDLGFYRQQGLDVSILSGGPTIASERVVESGRADIGVDWLSSLLVARDRGAHLTNIAQIFGESGMRLVTFKRSGIRSVTQLRGKRVGVWFAGNQYPFEALARRYHLSPPRNYMTVVPQDFTMHQFLTGAIDVGSATTYNELGTVYEHGVKSSDLRIFDYNRLDVGVLEDGLFASTGWLRTHAAIAVRFLRASIAGWQWAVAHPDEAGAISYRHEAPGYSTLAHQTYMAHAVVPLLTAGLGGSHTIGYMNPQRYSRTWHILLAQGVIHRTPQSAYDARYWRAAGGS